MSKLIDDARDRLATQAALRAGRELSERALDALTLSPQEQAARDAEREAQRRAMWLRVGLYAVGGLVAVVMLLGVLARLWRVAMALVLVAAVAGVAWLVVKPRIDALRARWRARDDERAAAAAHEAQRAAAAEAQQAAVRKIDDELAALKKRV